MLDQPDNSDSDGSQRTHQCAFDSTDGASTLSFDEETITKMETDLKSIGKWFHGFSNQDKINEEAFSDVDLLCSGRLFSEILNKIDDLFFNDDWLISIPTSTSNVLVKRSNMRRLWKKLEVYIENSNRTVNPKRFSALIESIDNVREDLIVAVEFASLIITLAHVIVHNNDAVMFSQNFAKDHREEMISIAAIIEKVKEDVIPKEENSFPSSHQNGDNQSEVEISFSTHQNSFNNGRVSISDSAVPESVLASFEELEAENKKLSSEVDRLTKQLESVEVRTEGPQSSTSDTTISVLEKMNTELKVKKREADEKVLEMESQLEVFSATVKKLTIENDELRPISKENTELKNELQHTKFELEEAQDKIRKAEFDVDLLKRKEKELKELQQRDKMLNDKLEFYVKQSSAEEDQKAGIAHLRQTIGALKAENETKDMELISKNQRIKKMEEELIGQKEKVKDLNDRVEELVAERNALQEKILRTSENITERSLHDSIFDGGNLNFEAIFNDKSKTEFDVDLLKQKEEELEELQQRNKMLNDKLEFYVKQSSAEEDQKADIAHLRQTIGALKAENETKDMELISKNQRNLKLEEELIGQKEKVKDLNDRVEELVAERNAGQEEKTSDNIAEISLHDSIFGDGNLSFEATFNDRSKAGLDVDKPNVCRLHGGVDRLRNKKTAIIALIFMFVVVYGSQIISKINAPPTA